MSLILRYMRVEDIPLVNNIDSLCFEPPWSKDSYAFEIKESRISHMVVLEEQLNATTVAAAEEAGWWQRFGLWLRHRSPAAVETGAILGYGGLWKIDSEAHISTIATHPDHRGRGFGELLLAGMFRKALLLKQSIWYLEVRVSNEVAQNLYLKYGFSQHGRKRTIIAATTKTLSICVCNSITVRASAVCSYTTSLSEMHNFRDNFTRVTHPRGK